MHICVKRLDGGFSIEIGHQGVARVANVVELEDVSRVLLNIAETFAEDPARVSVCRQAHTRDWNDHL